MAQPKTLLVFLSGGGWEYQMRRLLRGLGDGFDYVYVVPDGAPYDMSRYPPGPVHVAPEIATISAGYGPRFFLKALRVGFQSLGVIVRRRPDAVIAIGTATAIPFFFWARLLGKKAVFIESITRVATPSRTAQIVSRLGLCHKIYVQWPEMAEAYPGTVYQGVVI